MLISQSYVKRCFVNFLVIFGDVWKETDSWSRSRRCPSYRELTVFSYGLFLFLTVTFASCYLKCTPRRCI